MTLAVFLVALGATLRLTRLAIDDSILDAFHNRLTLLAHTEENKSHKLFGWLTQLFSCPWCIGFWISAAVTACAASFGQSQWFFYPAAALSISWLVGILHTAMYTLEGDE